MAIVAVTGDMCTTTAVALASALPASEDAIVVEADPSGGDLAAWFDLHAAPTLSSVVTRLGDGSWSEIERSTTLAQCGLRVIPAPVNAAETQQAVNQSARSLVPTLAALSSTVAVVDAGAAWPWPAVNPFVVAAAVTVLVHRQSPHSAPASAVRLQRLVAQIEAVQGSSSGLVVVVVGGAPFDLAEIGSFLADATGSTALVGLPVDDLTAAVYAGRAGVSQRRLARLPMARAARAVADTVTAQLGDRIVASWRPLR